MKLYFLARLFLFVFFLSLFSIHSVKAHKLDYAAINTTLTVRDGDVVFLRTEIPKEIHILENPEENKKISQIVAEKYYDTSFDMSLLLYVKKERCRFALAEHSVSAGRSTFDGKFVCKNKIKSIEDISIRNALFQNKIEKFDHFVNVKINNKTWDMVFTRDKIRYPGPVKASEPKLTYDNLLSVAADFTKSGVEHIWKGYDHVLFLLSAILLLRRLKSILIVVTSFTVAHSITLTLAALDIFTLPARLVEPLIALSIIYLAARNLMVLRSKDEKEHLGERWTTTFGFGLIHGLGFASVLKEAGIPDQYFAGSLAFFNIGIELGQLAILLVVVPVLLLLDRYKKHRLVLSAITAVIAIYAAFLLVQRLIY